MRVYFSSKTGERALNRRSNFSCRGALGIGFKGDGPPEWEALQDEWDDVFAKILAATLREYGEPGMADMYLNRRAEFDRKCDEGKRIFDEQ